MGRWGDGGMGGGGDGISFYSQCPMPIARCPLPNAQCPMPN
ncbi:histidine kinase [Tolypothrix sp. VBCCA 56010]